ncbi:putative glucan endo-1,3-beta-glucosidase [Psilocybe cubensis]|uniref:Rhamnogalacturonase A/B/Epimerase-like pectate lyase domain-containing protein n=2 Tax=Psilocybe cubensis TaxID=181762 RepID=A0A8H7Y5J9_PSICU|nr:putative glucan endo-1,3-beta-glucosidase [Psilocybe cubensis]KAH9484138.1 putative glucan endo-1,3-beta-glucosidase [Psilocybe cubensis]
MQSIKHQGTSAFNSNPSGYQVFRNVKDFGAKGDGFTDDTVAINNAITAGSRCGGGTCASSTLTPAVVFFPQGTYIISAPIIAYYYTQLIGDAKNPPTLRATSSFNGIAVIDADPYIPGGNGAQFYVNQNNFFRSVRNFVIDVRQVPATASQGTGLHWQASQSTSLINVVVEMSTAPNTAHQGIFMENGSGGFMGDLVFNGGKFGMWVGNQQFTVRNVTVNNAQSGIFSVWNWGWTYQGITINNCQVGFDVATGGVAAGDQTSGAIAIIDATIHNTPIFVRTSTASNGKLDGSIVINNAMLTNVSIAVGVQGGATLLAGGTTTITSWGQGNVYKGSNGGFIQGTIVSANKPSPLLDSSGKIFGRTHPQYANFAVSQFVSVKDNGAKGDGKTDDTAAITAIFQKFSGCKIIFFDAGTYIVTSTITIPAGTQIVGEAWSVIAGKGSAFQNQNSPTPVVKVGESNSQGIVEITDMLFTTIGPAAGAIVVEWNVKQPSGTTGGAGMWDSHIRLGGAAGTNLEPTQCPRGATPSSNCAAAFLALHLTPASTAYLEGTWVWLADHDIDGDGSTQVQIYSGRGILSESAGPVWMIGTAEHHVLYQYNLANAKNHYMGLIQTETPYFQPNPAPPTPFSANSAFHDPPSAPALSSAWALNVQGSTDIIVFGAGLYSFFQDFTQTCLNSNSCQSQILNIDTTSSVTIYSLSTVATTFQISIGQNGIINQSANANGFASTVTAWSRS